ncbi:helix-hairpin-helix domain-containing protein [Halobaculum magnesiiphilum]|uniref:DNA polymerase beta n=1 Tax=Halobaculum magnesiiphilum TaxID=1017351 RepID=A0A8T8WAG7_9EURY|nr:helix-hairpin-helix domain-containing protein [Halobaculum magnesiiphilum]QZP36753.1 PHP domain-containing protein [Halobaculum magnesiiphilum]
MRNAEVAGLLEEFADLLEAQGVEYKPNAYRRAADNVRDHPRAIEDLASEGGEDAVAEIDRVGDAIAAKIVEYLETGEIAELEELREDLPVDMAALTRVEGVGPKTVGTLYEELEITTLDELEAAAEAGKIQEIKGFGAKTEQNILDNVAFAREAGQRQRLGDARPLAEEVMGHLDGEAAVERLDVAGSIRRWKDTIGDVDVLVGSEDGEAVVDLFTDWPDADEVIEAGEQKASVSVDGIRVDLRVVVPEEFGSALQYFTGSKAHNVTLRNLAIDRGLKLNEYGVFDVSELRSDGQSDADASDDVSDVDDPDAGQRVGERLGGAAESEMYGALDLPVIPPELREDTGEIEAAVEGDLPDLLTEGEIRGDLHTHTEWSDGASTVAEMVQAAADYGYDYHCVTDHAEGPGVFGDTGLTDEEVREQAEAVAAVREDVDIEVFHGVEANVDADGDVTTSDDLLADLDIVVASPHAALDQGDATDRLIRAVKHPHVDILGHPTGRLINQRPGLEIDFERLAEAAADADTALEVNANPARLDLHGDAVRAAVEAGATVAIDTDAHSPAEFGNVRYGVHTARRGWAEATDVLNARDADGLRAFLDG